MNHKRIVVLQGHPDLKSFSSALAAAYVDGARDAGAAVDRLDLGALGFDPVLRAGHHGEQPFEPDLVRAFEAIQGAQHVTFTFPTWWAGPPALVKGFIDRVFLPKLTFRYDPGQTLPVGLLAGRSARLITTMDSPSFWYWWKHRSSLHRSFVDGTLDFVGFKPVRTNTFYDLRSKSAEQRASLLATARRAGAQDASRA